MGELQADSARLLGTGAQCGGGIINGATAAQQVALTRSIPSGNPATGWSVQAEQTNTGTTVWTLVAEVVCT